MANNNSKKLCVFCGNMPEEKTMEHILPMWLLKLTGDPHRKGVYGTNLTTDEVPAEVREFAASSFKFAACRVCNEEFGKLESLAKPVMLSVLANEAVGNEEITILLDWFDKVRIGLWLAFNRLDDFSTGFLPTFHIKLGQTLKDRALCIYDYPDPTRSVLTVYGANAPIFYVSPAAFVLVVNNKLFLSAAADFLVAKNLGFAYGELVMLRDDSPDPIYRLRPGTGVATYPVLPFSITAGGTELYQLVRSAHNHPEASDANRRKLFLEARLLQTRFQGYKHNEQVIVSRIFYKKPMQELILLAEEAKVCLQSPARCTISTIANVIADLFLKFQVDLWLKTLPSSPEAMTPTQRRLLPQTISSMLNIQLKHLKAGLANMAKPKD